MPEQVPAQDKRNEGNSSHLERASNEDFPLLPGTKAPRLCLPLKHRLKHRRQHQHRVSVTHPPTLHACVQTHACTHSRACIQERSRRRRHYFHSSSSSSSSSSSNNNNNFNHLRKGSFLSSRNHLHFGRHLLSRRGNRSPYQQTGTVQLLPTLILPAWRSPVGGTDRARSMR